MSRSCCAANCVEEAAYEVILFDVYEDGEVFWERDTTCEFLCAPHVAENESRARGERRPRGIVSYPHTNREGAQGLSIYRPLK